MPASFLVTLDRTTHIGLAINGGAGSTQLDTVTLELALDEDAVQVKIWGDINPLDPANSEYGETEADAPWITASPSFLVNLTTSPGSKNLSARVKDDVDNEAVATASIILGEEVAPPTPPTQRPKPVPGKPEPPRPEPEMREVLASSSGVALTTSATVSVRTASRSRGVTTHSLTGLVQGRIATAPSEIEIATSVHPYTRTDVNRSTLVFRSADAGVGKRDDPAVIAALLAMGDL